MSQDVIPPTLDKNVKKEKIADKQIPNMVETKKNSQDLLFQILDWSYFHEENDDGKKQFAIRLFGRTKENKTIYVKVSDYTPYFYIDLPDNFLISNLRILFDEVKKRVWPKDNADGLIEYKMANKHKFYGFTNYKKFNFVQLIFRDYDSMRSYANVFKKSLYIKTLARKPIKYQLYESNIEPFLRCMHLRNLEAVGWVNIKNTDYIDMPSNVSCCEINASTHWTKLNKVEDRSIMPFVIASFDIECTSGDGTFPQATRDADQIIQIGTTFSRFGEDECFYQHMITFDPTGTCGLVENTDVVACKSEKDLLLEWTKLMRRMNPDIVTGYNVVGFDFKYMRDRAEKLGILNTFSKLSRITGEVSEWKETKLASAALGENILRYFNMTGRVIIDMLKVAQRDHKLDSYKLDFVASWFIREEIQKMEYVSGVDTLITTKSTYGLKNDQFITVFYNDGLTDNKHMDGKKFKVLQLTKTSILIEGKIDDDITKEKKNKVFWCQAKDDISPADIFRLQRGTKEDRAIVAKYCIMDCVLCIKLMNKLQVITNNIGMANVCYVPFSYLFMRGQGVKIYSLVSRKCREKNHLIKTSTKKKKLTPEEEEKEKEKMKKFKRFVSELNNPEHGDPANNDDDDDEGGYEGATVFPPKKGVYYEPVPVLDYASLYPNAMILRNLSHEMFINDEKYSNIPGYRYHTITYKNGDDTLSTCRFAEKLNNTKGIIPEILMELLAARKKYKRMMEDEKDPFKKSVLDGLQQAYKVTANSLYGQTGSVVSPIYLKEIAASTTATGREMLQYSKYFIENTYATMINLAQKSKKEYLEYMRKIYKYHPNKVFAQETQEDGTNKDIEITICTDANSEIADSRFYRPKEKDPDINFANKEEFFELFYNRITKLLDGYTIKPEIIYGDSVTHDTPVLLRKLVNDEYITEIKTIDSINSKWMSYDNGMTYKQQNITDIEYQVWSDKGWTKINRVIRHKTTKKIYEISTSNGCVKVTENHSLLRPNGDVIKPTECVIGTELLQSYPNVMNIITSRIPPHTGDIRTETFCVSDAFHSGYEFGITGVCDDSTITNVMNSTPDEIFMFLTTYHEYYERPDEIAEKYPNGIVCKDQKMASVIYYLLRSCNKTVQIIPYNNVYIVDKLSDIEGNTIISIKEIGTTKEYVYDLETESHHFQAGVGNIIVHNTDSVFFCPHIVENATGKKLKDQKALEMCIQLGIWASVCICILLPGCMAQEYEKVLWPFMILTKKRYVGNLYEKNPHKFKQKSMGIVLKRRDNAPIVKVVCGGIVDQILNKHSSEGAVNFARKTLKDILCKKYPIDKFIITKTLKETYKDRSRIVHAVLADRMARRDPGNKPQSNDRIAYVFVVINEEEVKKEKYIVHMEKLTKLKELHGKKFNTSMICTKKACQSNDNCVCYNELIQGDIVDSVDYVLKNDIPIDYLVYITNQISKPANQFLELIAENSSTIFDEYVVREETRRKKIPPINYFFKDETGTNNSNVVSEGDNSDFLLVDYNDDTPAITKAVAEQSLTKKRSMRSKTVTVPRKKMGKSGSKTSSDSEPELKFTLD